MQRPSRSPWLPLLALSLFCSATAVAEGPRRDDCGLEPPGSPPWPALPRKAFELRSGVHSPHVRREPGAGLQTLQGPWGASGQGGLVGKTVYLSPGHGFTFVGNSWSTQRGTTNGIVEDLASAEAVHQYLLRYLHNAGARVVSVREQDLTEKMAIVDEADGGAYFEEGAAGRFFATAEKGFGRYGAALGDQVPFTLGRTRLLSATDKADAAARFVPDVPADGEYHVYVSYAAGANRAPDAHYVVRHLGGESHFRVDQRRHGGTWVLLGRFFFGRGQSPEHGAVQVLSDSKEAGAVISLDAVRLGGGAGDIDRGKGKSGRPRWEEAARYYTQFNGAPAEVWDNPNYEDHDDDVGSRSRFAAWDHEDGEDAVYLAWHTNAPDPGVGTSSYVYGPNPPDGNYMFTGVPGSDTLMTLVHQEIVGDLKKGWDPSWRDRGRFTAYFGEVNPRHNPETPAALIEVAFHSTLSDATQLKQAGFRRLVARAMYQGIAKYFAQKDKSKLVLAPEPPTGLCLRGGAAGTVTLTVHPGDAGPAGLGGDAPTAYRVYRSKDGRAFDDGEVFVPDQAGTITLRGLTAGAPLFVRVTAVNAGGESLAAPLVAVRPRRSGGGAKVLLVSGFDRVDGGMLVKQDLSAYGLSIVQRMLLDRMNDTGYLAAHGRALAQDDFAFDSCDHSALLGGDAPRLDDYGVVVWAAGEQSVSPAALAPAERALLTRFRDGGGRLILSGSEALYALVEKGDAASKDFVAGLGVSYLKDSANSLVAQPAAGGIFDGMPPVRFDDSQGGYLVDYPDVLAAAAGGQVALRYQGMLAAGQDGAAVVNDPMRPTVAVFGFPLESVYDEAVRAELLRRLLAAMDVAADPKPADVPDGGAGDAPDLGTGDDPYKDARYVGGCSAAGGGGAGAAAPLLALGLLLLRRRRG